MKRILLIILTLLSTAANAQTITIEDSLGLHRFEQPPQRVVALNWTAMENLVELGITPLAATDIHGYKTWVRQPALPDNIVDVGTRDAPSLERIAQLKPDLIIIGGLQQNLLPKLQPIAPVLTFKAFSEHHNNYKAGRHIFMQLAKLFNKQSQAEQKLAAKDQRLQELKNKLNTHFNQTPPSVSTIHFINPALIRVFGDNSMPQYALEQLGISPALPQSKTQWGMTQKRVIELGKVENGIVLYFEPFDQKQKLFNTPLWRAMPFVRKQHFAALPPNWTYGGAMSVLYLAEAISEQLLAMEP